jgi:hypothetical protein
VGPGAGAGAGAGAGLGAGAAEGAGLTGVSVGDVSGEPQPNERSPARTSAAMTLRVCMAPARMSRPPTAPFQFTGTNF